MAQIVLQQPSPTLPSGRDLTYFLNFAYPLTYNLPFYLSLPHSTDFFASSFQFCRFLLVFPSPKFCPFWSYMDRSPEGGTQILRVPQAHPLFKISHSTTTLAKIRTFGVETHRIDWFYTFFPIWSDRHNFETTFKSKKSRNPFWCWPLTFRKKSLSNFC